jgi:predicted RND superfamily exporter protein
VNVARALSALAGAAGRFGDACVSLIGRRPRAVVLAALALGMGAGALALSLRPSAAADTFVGRSSATYRATQRYYRAFGEEPIVVVVQGSLEQLMLSSDLQRLAGLEGCLAGKVPPAGLLREGGANGPCGQLARLGTVKVVIGPGTFVDEAVRQIDQLLAVQSNLAEARAREDQRTITRLALARGRSAAEARRLGEEASRYTLERYAGTLALLGARYGLSAPPSIEDPNFVYTLVFDNTARLPGTPKQRFAYLFPSREAALVSVRLKAGLSEARRTRTLAAIRRALAMPQWRPQHGERYLLTGEPVIVADLTSSLTRTLELLLVAVLLVMAVTLTLVFRGRPRLLPLGVAVLATALTFGALAAVGASLTVAQVAVLPVLVGLAVDYAIQFHSRVQEADAAGGGDPAERRREAIVRATAAAGPTLLAAAAAGAGALLVTALSPVPTVRGFGLLLVVGLALALACALTVGSAVLTLTAPAGGHGDGVLAGEARRTRGPLRGPSGSVRAPFPPAAGVWAPLAARVSATLTAAGAQLAPSWRGAQELLRDNALTRLVSRAALVYAVRSPGRVLGVGLVLAALGWALDTRTRVETNLERLVPQSMASLRGLDALERASGVGGEIDLMVSGRDVASPRTIEWMSAYQEAVLKRFGYSSTRGCGVAQLCPAFSLPSLFEEGGTLGSGALSSAARRLSAAEVDALLRTIPAYFSQNALTADRRVATLAFGIRLMPLTQQQHVIEAMRAALHPPPGTSVQLVGLPVLAAQSGAVVASPWRRVLTLLAALAAAAVVLLLAFRGDARRALVPLVPVLLATGWSSLAVFAIRVPLNPMSVTLSALVIAVSTEFSVLLCERVRQERQEGGAAGWRPASRAPLFPEVGGAAGWRPASRAPLEGGGAAGWRPAGEGDAGGAAGRGLAEALRIAYARTGAAVAASGVTAIAGFGVLVLSDVAMLRDFGVVTVVDLTVSLLGVLVALPAAVLLGESSPPARELARLGARLRSATPRARRRPRHEAV